MIEALIVFLIYILILGVVIWLLLYVVDTLPIPPPFRQVARVCIVVIGVLILILLLLQLVGGFQPLQPLHLR